MPYLLRIIVLGVALALPAATLPGCAQGTNIFGSTALAPQTFNERLAVAYTAVTGIRQSATTLLGSNTITAEDGDNVLKATDVARAGLDIARKLSTLDLTSADAKLNAVSITLTALSEYLTTRSK